MEESNEVPPDENKISSETNKKRMLKTPTQLNGLENFYNEHKYPTEEQKKQLAQQLSLTEKQVSGWFCHRRLKDKRLSAKGENTNGRQDRSSGVIYDHGSGHRQDSCDSTKRGSHWHDDPREVESQSLQGRGFPVGDHSYDCKSPLLRDARNMDNTSSESSSPLQDRIGCKSTELLQVENSRYCTVNGVIGSKCVANAKQREYKPSGYLKVRGEFEHTAITAVKMRLGRHYCEDGPLLSVQFESVPPGAFRTTANNSACEPYYLEDPGMPHLPNISGAEERIHDINHRAHTAQINFRDQSVDDANPHGFQNAYGEHNPSQHCPKQMSLKPENSLVGQKSPLDTYKHAAGEVSAYNCRDYDKTNSRLDEVFASDRFLDRRLGPYSGKSIDEHTEHLLYNSDKTSPKFVQTAVLKSKHPRVKLRCTEPFDTRARVSPKMKHHMQKKEKPYDKKKLEVSHNLSMPTKRGGSKIHRQERIVKSSAAERAPLANHFEGSAKDMPSSFSEDETADASSSLN